MRYTAQSNSNITFMPVAYLQNDEVLDLV